MQKSYFVLIWIFSANIACNAADFKQDSLLQLNKPADVSDAQTLQNTVDAMSKKVTECVNNKTLQSDECFCQYPNELAQIKQAYEKILVTHPAWKDQVLFWWRDESHSYSHSLSLKVLKQSLERKCPTLR